MCYNWLFQWFWRLQFICVNKARSDCAKQQILQIVYDAKYLSVKCFCWKCILHLMFLMQRIYLKQTSVEHLNATLWTASASNFPLFVKSVTSTVYLCPTSKLTSEVLNSAVGPFLEPLWIVSVPPLLGLDSSRKLSSSVVSPAQTQHLHFAVVFGTLWLDRTSPTVSDIKHWWQHPH